jgi:hypothetical protein
VGTLRSLVTAGWDLRHQIHGPADAVSPPWSRRARRRIRHAVPTPDELCQPRETEQDDQLNSKFHAEIP